MIRLLATLAALLAFSACGDDTTVPESGDGDGDGDVVIVGTGDGDGDGDSSGDGDGDSSGDGDGDSSGDGDGDGDASTRTIIGTAYSMDGAQVIAPLAGATIEDDEGNTTTTDAAGAFALQITATSSRVSLRSEGSAYQSRTIPRAGDNIHVELVSAQVGSRRRVDPYIGATVRRRNGAAARLGAGDIDLASNTSGPAPRASVRVSVASINPTIASNRRSYPADFPGQGAGGELGALDAESVLEVSVEGDGGPLGLSAGAAVQVDFPTSAANPPRRRRLFSFNESAGSWVEEGVAALTRNSAGQRVYRATIRHLSWWAVGELVDETTCLRACVRTSADMPAALVRVTATAVERGVQTAQYTGADGCVALDAPASTQVRIDVEGPDEVLPAGVFLTSTMPMTVMDDPAACEDLGVFTLGPRALQDCPGDMQACNGTCVDIHSDAAHCGVCNQPCALAGQDCLAGSCGCSAGQTQCNDGQADLCADLDGDDLHCGACNNACAPGEVCSGGGCYPMACSPGLTDCAGVCVDLAVDGDNFQCPDAAAQDCGAGRDACDDVCADLSSDLTDCGGCGIACGDGEICNTGTCEVLPGDCPAGRVLCGGGCVDTMDNDAHCGGCQQDCTGIECISGTCVDTCQPGPEMCNGVDDDCDRLVDEAAEAGCPGSGAQFRCEAGLCTVMTCDANLGNCDGWDENGCEADLDDPAHCGSCQKACKVLNGSPSCSQGICGIAGCDDDWDDCGGDALPLTCETPLDTLTDCGSCGRACGQVLNGTLMCGGVALEHDCEIASCGGGFLDCDFDASTGCEVDPSVDALNCGGCGVQCAAAPQVAMASCAGSTCRVDGCNPSFGDCNAIAADGCEVDVDADLANCGGCGMPCPVLPNATTNCISGACQLVQCDSGFDDCNAVPADGCEVEFNVDPGNCGACGNDCNALPNVLTTSCTVGVCTGSCAPGWDDCNADFTDGCEAQGC